ncbi:hypothetical protein QR680_003110 [Steinernema hermaphroditum]|uniref:Uncharacterized protein n=1 Tax=Steinernema hermaphroditum TaxID=289476 RepID=A0AA39H6F5_9BILA|nr:hypothetical protein QR680_003110 [Steinernema hermaphroditum]
MNRTDVNGAVNEMINTATEEKCETRIRSQRAEEWSEDNADDDGGRVIIAVPTAAAAARPSSSSVLPFELGLMVLLLCVPCRLDPADGRCRPRRITYRARSATTARITEVAAVEAVGEIASGRQEGPTEEVKRRTDGKREI